MATSCVQPEDQMDVFAPDARDAQPLRQAFARFATGVTIVTAAEGSGAVAITANSFSSVSLDPPLVLWCPDKASRRHGVFTQAEHYAIHILAADQGDLAMAVARSADAVPQRDVITNPEGVPVLRHALARFDCQRHAIYDGGDHDIVLGRVLRVAVSPRNDALGFFQGAMTSITG